MSAASVLAAAAAANADAVVVVVAAAWLIFPAVAPAALAGSTHNTQHLDRSCGLVPLAGQVGEQQVVPNTTTKTDSASQAAEVPLQEGTCRQETDGLQLHGAAPLTLPGVLVP